MSSSHLMDADRLHRIAQAAIARDRVERAQHLLAGVIEDWSMPGEKYDNVERVEHAEAALAEALERVRTLRAEHSPKSEDPA